jgi:[acyl-carrier-protein] S-malonyltransferase
MTRALVLCPGRGSYGRDALGSLKNLKSDALDVFDGLRASQQRPTVREMDGAEKYASKLHIRGENASALTAGASLADLDQVDHSKFQIVGVTGNSMGWYTALGYANALPMSDCATLVETMGQYQAGNIVGGQIVYPLVNEDWTRSAEKIAGVDALVEATPDLYWSIRLGGQAVLGGTEPALKKATAALEPIERGAHTFPIRLPLHSAFHTPLMDSTSTQACDDLSLLGWKAPRVTMFDGLGRVFRPHSADPQCIRDYTLGAQVTETFDLSLAIKTALRTVAPEVVILPGPGSNLGSAVAQIMIEEGWAGITSRDDFVSRQNNDPILLSMRWPDQRKRVVGS